jgi:Xaa-Pro aminopeptidase
MPQMVEQSAVRQPLPPCDVAARLDRLRPLIASASCEALLVTKIHNVQYLTGFSGSTAQLLVRSGDATLLTDGRYGEQAREQLKAHGVEAEVEVDRTKSNHEPLRRLVRGIGRLGLESADITWGAVRDLEIVLSGTTMVPTRGLVESLRRVKDSGELARIERAADIADIALAQLKHRLLDGVTDREMAAELELEMRRRGADGVAFDTIVAAGPDGAKPHARPSGRAIAEGELVVIDFGARVDGYRSDMTRTLCVGEPGSRARELVDAVLAAQRAGVRAVRPGATARSVDEASRSLLVEAGLGEAFLHGTGHGVGLEIHEAPAISADSVDILEEGAVVTVEPGVYIDGLGGVRIEDTVVVTADGARPLTKSTKDLTL